MRQEVQNKLKTYRGKNQVNLVKMEIKDGEIQEIIKTIKQWQHNVSTINWDNNILSDEGALALAKCLSDLHHLTELSVQFNQIGKEGAIALFKLKRERPELDILFHGNKIYDVSEMLEIEHIAGTQESPKI